MNEQEQRIAIAEACGWTTMLDKPLMVGRRGLGQTRSLPDYLHDLNACAKFEATLTDEEFLAYDETLWELTEAETLGNRPFISATAPQRCEAFLRVKGAWKESSDE